MGDLGVTIVTGFQPEVDYLERVGKNKLNFGYGVNFKYNGEIHNNLDRVWVVQRFNLPKELDNYVKGMKFGLDCSYTYVRLPNFDKGRDYDSNNRLNFMKDVCRQTKPLMETIERGAYHYQKILEKLVNHDIPNALHKLPIVGEVRYKRTISTGNVSKHVIHDHLQAGSEIDKHEQVYTNSSLENNPRKKRGILGIALPFVGKLATIAIEALESHLQRKRRRALAKASEKMQSNQFLTKNQLFKIKQDFLMFGDYEVQTTDGMIKLLRNLNNRTVNLEAMLTGKDSRLASLYLNLNLRGTQVFADQVNMYVHAMRERYLRVPENLINEPRLLLRSIAIKGLIPEIFRYLAYRLQCLAYRLQFLAYNQHFPAYKMTIPCAKTINLLMTMKVLQKLKVMSK